MKLSEAVAAFEKCMDGPGHCLFDNCPLHRDLEIQIGDLHDEQGGITWHIEGCSLFGVIEQVLEKEKPGTPIPEEDDETEK